MNFLWTLLMVLLVITLGFGVYHLYLYALRRRSAVMAKPEELQEVIRRVQVVDLREPVVFDRGHILGARNIPYPEFKMRHQELRIDRPIYLYDDGLTYVSQAANTLKKSGYEQVYILEGGFPEWTGRTKSNE